MKVKQKGNAFAICRAMQKRRGWSERKYKHCAEQIKGRKK